MTKVSKNQFALFGGHFKQIRIAHAYNECLCDNGNPTKIFNEISKNFDELDSVQRLWKFSTYEKISRRHFNQVKSSRTKFV